MSTETFSRSFRGYRRSEVDTAKMRSDLRIEQLEYELSNMTQRANAMQVEIRDLYGRIDESARARELALGARWTRCAPGATRWTGKPRAGHGS